jgi:predicted transcriptional regulator of viral defense system
MPTKKFNTAAGTINVATPEVIAADIVTMPQYAAGISNVATVLIDLSEKIDIQRLLVLTKLKPELYWLQRLGFLLEFLGFKKLANGISEILINKKIHWARLVSHVKYKPLQRNKKWKIIMNTYVEPDE